MTKGPLKRGQVIAPFGVGALVIVKDGTSAIGCGLDHWYVPEGGVVHGQEIDIEEFKVEEWRLQKLLMVNHLRLPPDFRRKQRGHSMPNTGLTIPFLRFPTWHFCPYCKSLRKLPLSAKGFEPCTWCQSEGRRIYVVQVPFIAVCDHGHIQDFPWKEWLHGINSTCNGRMRLLATGGASLADQKVTCDCGKQRTLANITTADPDGKDSFLSKNLDLSGAPYRCIGLKPWLGDDQTDTCNQPLRGSLRSASNVYFARMHSAIYLPKSSQGAPAELIALLKVPPLSSLIALLRVAGATPSADSLRQQHRELLKPYSDAEVSKALASLSEEENDGTQEAAARPEDSPDTAFRRAEFEVLKRTQDQRELMTRRERIEDYSSWMRRFFSAVTLIHKLRETRAFSGFSRILPDDGISLSEHKKALWRTTPGAQDSWLPATVIFGEGIFLELNEALLREWEDSTPVRKLVAALNDRHSRVQSKRKSTNLSIEPRFVLAHTLAHVLMNKLSFECGYGSASLRERMYVSADRHAPMAGVLIYTAAGDADGTMGGLVRMGKPGYLEPILEKAIRDAHWCSTDPVCMEIGQKHGQGPEACNGAACHNCALVPETSCENFNRSLDRATLVGAHGHPELGFFSK